MLIERSIWSIFKPQELITQNLNLMGVFAIDPNSRQPICNLAMNLNSQISHLMNENACIISTTTKICFMPYILRSVIEKGSAIEFIWYRLI
jgi:hypothetical protein